MSHPQPPTRQPTQDETARYVSAMHNVAIGVLVVCPVLALLPPRKFDTYTIGLAGLTVYSANHLYRESTGRSIWDRINASRVGSSPESVSASLPTDRAREFQQQWKEQREAQMQREGRTTAETEKAKQGVLDKIWMGKETEGWSEKREKEVQEALAEGKGYGDIIMDQIWDVWNWGKKTDEDDSTSSEK